MTKEELAAAMVAFEQKGGKVEEVPVGVSGRSDVESSSLRFCTCGCYGDWTDHTMRLGEGKFADQ